jgi:SAM-dependent methyltransferase
MLKAGFDRAVSISPEASVAAYSLADPLTLGAATNELVTWMTDRALLQPQYRVLDLGCGIGRVAAAIAPRVRAVLGIDISPAMIAEARRRQPRLQFEVTDGLGLRGEAASLDLIIAVDSFPYLVQAEVAECHVADAARLLRAGGVMAIFNLSYHGLHRDHAVARIWCNSYGFRLTCDGATPFRLWDAAVFIMYRLAN